MQRQIREIANQYESMNEEFANNEKIFLASKDYVVEVQEQLRQAETENDKIRQDNFRL